MKIRDRTVHTQQVCPGFDTLLHYDGKPRSRITLAFIQEHQLAIMVYGTIPLYWRGGVISRYSEGNKTIGMGNGHESFGNDEIKRIKNSPNPFLILRRVVKYKSCDQSGQKTAM